MNLPARPLALRRKALAVMAAACHGAVYGNPITPQVLAGQALFSRQGNVFPITNGPDAIIHWQGFSIQPYEITRFLQQGSDSRVLNRVTGQVTLINPNGVLAAVQG